jgi:hypothetical protein
MAVSMIHLLGRPRTAAGAVRGRKPWAITAYLALSGVPVSRERLIALLFGGHELLEGSQLESAVRLFRGELGCAPAASVFLAAEHAPVKTTGPATAARVRALLEAGTAQVAAGAVDAAVQVLRTACDEAARNGDPRQQATARLALGGTLIEAGTARHQEGELALHRAITLAQRSGEPSIAVDPSAAVISGRTCGRSPMPVRWPDK